MLNKLGKHFAKKQAGICVDINEIFDIFHLHDANFKQDPAYHGVVLASMKAQKQLHGPSRVYYSDPSRNFKVERNFGMVPDPDEADPDFLTVNGSPSVAFTEQDLGNDHRGFGMIIRKTSENKQDLRSSMVFGIYGTYNKKDQLLHIERLYTPTFGEGNTITEAQPIPIDEANVKGALSFAMYCADQIYAGETFNPRACFAQAINADLDKIETPKVTRFEP